MMRAKITKGLSALWLVAGAAGVASAEPKRQPPPGFTVPQETIERYEALRKAAVTKPRRWQGQRDELGDAREVAARLMGYVDGTAQLGLPLTPKQRAVLVKQGVPEVESLARAGARVIFEGRLVTRFYVDGVPEVHFERRVGQQVRVTLQRRKDGHVFVVGIRDAR